MTQIYSKMVFNGEVVEVVGTGHYPDTVIIKLGDGTQTEVYVSQLKETK